MDGVNQIISRLHDFVESHAVDVSKDLLEYEVKRNGIISAVSFHRWISSIGINLSNRNIQTIILTYQLGDGLDVHKLISDIEQSTSFTKTLYSTRPQCTKELLDLAKELARRRQNIREVLEVYDRQNTGKVIVNNFYRAFGSSPTTTTIANCYAMNGDIDYLRLGNDIYNVVKSQNIHAPMVIPEETPAFRQLATYIKHREVDPRVIFSQQDRLNTGKMPKKQFNSTLSFFGASISPKGIDEISNSFDDRDGLCNYNLFIKAVEQFVPPPPQATQALENAKSERPVQTPQTLLSAARATIADRRIELDLHFGVLGREGYTGDVIPLHKFVRIVSGMHIDLSYEEIESIASLFRGQNGIRYKDFVEAVRPMNTTRTISSNDVIPRLRDYLYETRQQLARVASKYDREHSGNISSTQLISCIQFVKFDASNQELAAMRDAFPGTEKNTVSWRDLCAQVDQPTKPYETPRNENDYDDVFNTSGRLQQSQSRPPVESNPPPKNVADIVRKLTSSSEVDIIAELKNYDKMKRGVLAQQGFVNAILALPVSISAVELRTVVSYYRVSGSSDINYIQFIKDSETLEHQAEEDLKTYRLSQPIQLAVDPLPQLGPQEHALIKRFKSFAEQRRFQPQLIFEPYDTFHNGTVQSYKVQSCFAQVDFPILRNELEMLIKAFPDQKRPEFFNYAQLVRAFNSEDITSTESRNSIAPPQISSEIEREADITCGQIREKLLARHRRIEMAFAGVNTPTVSTREFQKRIGLIDFVIHANQINALIRKYRVNLSDQVDWKRFCSDVNQTKTL